MSPAKRSAAGAKKSKAIDPDDIDLLSKKKADAKKLVQYVEQAEQGGEDPAPFLERVIGEGSTTMRAAAAPELARIKPAVAERVLLEALDAASSGPMRERTSLLSLIAGIGTESAIDVVIANMPPVWIEVGDLAPDVLAKLLPRAAKKLANATSAKEMNDIAHAFQLPGATALVSVDVARPILVQIVDDKRLHQMFRVNAASLLGERAIAGDALSRQAFMARTELDVVSKDSLVQVLLTGDPDKAFETLSATYRDDPYSRSTIARSLSPRADRRWVPFLMGLVEHDAMSTPIALAKLGAVDELLELAARPTLDTTTKGALAALGNLEPPDSRAPALLLRVLATPAGSEIAPLLLTALSQCGDVSSLRQLEAMLPTAGTRAGFFNHAISAIRARGFG